MKALAKCSLDVSTAESLRIEYRPLPAGAKRIVDKLIAAGGGGALERATFAHNSNLAADLNAEAQGGGESPSFVLPDAGQAMTAAAAASAAAASAAAAARARATKTPAATSASTPFTAVRIRAARGCLGGPAGVGATPATTPAGGATGADAKATEFEAQAAAAVAVAAELLARAAAAARRPAAAAPVCRSPGTPASKPPCPADGPRCRGRVPRSMGVHRRRSSPARGVVHAHAEIGPKAHGRFHLPARSVH